jgi:hypothetical protein
MYVAPSDFGGHLEILLEFNCRLLNKKVMLLNAVVDVATVQFLTVIYATWFFLSNLQCSLCASRLKYMYSIIMCDQFGVKLFCLSLI